MQWCGVPGPRHCQYIAIIGLNKISPKHRAGNAQRAEFSLKSLFVKQGAMGDDVELPTVAAGRDSDESLEAVESPPSLSPEAADFAEREGGQQQASEGAAAPSPAKSHSKAKKRGKKSKRYKKESSTSCDLVSSTGGGPVKGRGPGWGALAALAIGTAVTACAAAFIFPR